jgi:TctA family transporter
MVEENFRRALMLSRGDLGVFVTHPISAAFIGVSALIVGVQLVFWLRRQLLKKRNDFDARQQSVQKDAESFAKRQGL